MLSNFYRTTSQCWWRTPGIQKGSPFSLKGGRTKYKRQKRDKRVRDRDPSQGGSCKGGEVSKHQETILPLTGGSVGSFGISEGNITGRGKKKKKQTTTEYMPNHSSQWRNSPDTRICHQWAGAEQGGKGCVLRERTGHECPEDNLRELTLDSNPNSGIVKERERERTFPPKALT